VFSDVYAVLNKNWKENHHDRLCEILADVESECGVEISFVKGAYQFRGTLTAVSNVLKSLNCNVSSETSGGDAQHHARQPEELFGKKGTGPHSGAVHGNYDEESGSRNVSSETTGYDAQQHGELFGGKDTGPHSVEVYSNSDEVQPQSWNEGEDGNVVPPCSPGRKNLLPGRQSPADHNNRRILTNEDKPAEQQSTPHDTEQMEQMKNLPVDQVVSDNSAKSLHSIPASDVPPSHESDSTPQVKAEAHEENCPTDGNESMNRSRDIYITPPEHMTEPGRDTEMFDVGDSSAAGRLATPTVDPVVKNESTRERKARKYLIYARH